MVRDGPHLRLVEMALELTSPAFEHHGDIPARFTCEGADVSPPLNIAGLPAGTVGLALVVEDPDAPDPAAPLMVWDHWVLWNISPAASTIPEGSVPAGAVQGRNSWGRNDYGGPCPLIGRHRYFFLLYALDSALDLPPGADKVELQRVMWGHVLAEAELMGLYGS